MSDLKKIQVLEDVFGGYHRSGSEILFHCPKCEHHKHKLSFNLDKNKFQCWVCGWGGNQIYWAVKEHGDTVQKQKWQALDKTFDHSQGNPFEDIEEKKIELPKEFISLTPTKDSLLTRAARQYLYNVRGMTHYDILYWKIGFCPSGEYENRIIIPSFDSDGELNYFIARTIVDEWPTYKNPPVPKDLIFNELNLEWNKNITIVEGAFDAIKAQNAIPLLGSTLKEDSYIFNKIIEKCKRIYIALDADAERKENNIIDLLLTYGVEVCKVEIEPFGDVGEMCWEEFKNRKMASMPLTTDLLLEKLIEQI